METCTGSVVKPVSVNEVMGGLNTTVVVRVVCTPEVGAVVSPTVEERHGGRVPAAGTVPGAVSVPGAVGGSVPGLIGAGTDAVSEGWLVGASVLPHSVSVTVTVEVMYSNISLAHTTQNQTSLSDVHTTRVTSEQTSGQVREMVNLFTSQLVNMSGSRKMQDIRP